jgi:hypothetical protein
MSGNISNAMSLLNQYDETGVVTVPESIAVPLPHNTLDHGSCGCGKPIKSMGEWSAHRRNIAAGLLLRRRTMSQDVEPQRKLARQLAERNRLYGRASETIGRLRAEVARLRLERAEWRGTVNGDVLVEVLAASAPEHWTPEDRRRHAEDVMQAMQASGIEVRRVARPWKPEPGGLALIPRPGGPAGSGMIVRINRITEHGNVTWDSVDGAVLGASNPGVLRPVPESVVDGDR